MKWVFPTVGAVASSIGIIILLWWASLPEPLIIGLSVVLACFFLFFGAAAIKNYYVGPYSAAAARLRLMIRGDYKSEMAPSPISEANDLVSTINGLSRQLQEQSKTIERLERMRIDFVANVSHELKTPLTSIKGYTETLKGGALNDPKISSTFLNRIEENADRLSSIISDLLALSTIESFPGSVQWNVIETESLEKRLDSVFMPSLQKKNQKLLFHWNDSKIEGDVKKLEHALFNLVENANRYSPDGTVIEITQRKEPLHWILEVADNGPGIPAEHQPRIFERFYRVDAGRSRETGGTGLGLSIVKHIILLHDGTIELKSEPGKGTKFTLRWPRRTL